MRNKRILKTDERALPRSPRYPPERIVDTALQLVRAQGLEALSARRLARALGCTVRPIYRAFPSMEALRGAVLEQVLERWLAALLNTRASDPFFAMGLGYFRFAREEPWLYRALFSHEHPLLEQRAEALGPVWERMGRHPLLEGMEREALERILRQIWIYTHGLATLVSTGLIQDEEQRLQDQLEQAARLFIAQERGAIEL